MKTNAPKLSSYYEQLLYRYALRLVKHKLVAIIVVEEISRDYTEQRHAIHAKRIREYLRSQALDKCMQWMEAKENVLTAREPKDPT